MARKPLVGTVAANVLVHGTGALNIDGCRVATNGEITGGSGAPKNGTNALGDFAGNGGNTTPDAGRWPANLIHDGSDEVLAGFPVTTSGAMKRTVEAYEGDSTTGLLRGRSGPHNQHGDTGSAARFFYCAKASKRDRDEGLDHMPEQKTSVGDLRASGDFNERLGKTPGVRRNTHPTVKPTDLMAYLCRLVTPPGGVVLDPFMGSGSTGKAAMREGFRFIGIERDSEYVEIAKGRINAV